MSQATSDSRQREKDKDHPVRVGTPHFTVISLVASLQWPRNMKGSPQAAFLKGLRALVK